MFDAPDAEIDTGERLYPGYGSLRNAARHMERYAFASARLGRAVTVLDAACGSGYGSALLSSCRARSVIGIDRSPSALAYAKRYYRNDRLVFLCADLTRNLPLATSSLDAVVSFETLEHLSSQSHLIAEFARVLRPHGLLMLSTPDSAIHSNGQRRAYHVRELTKSEFERLLHPFFDVATIYGQLGDPLELPEDAQTARQSVRPNPTVLPSRPRRFARLRRLVGRLARLGLSVVLQRSAAIRHLLTDCRLNALEIDAPNLQYAFLIAVATAKSLPQSSGTRQSARAAADPG